MTYLALSHHFRGGRRAREANPRFTALLSPLTTRKKLNSLLWAVIPLRVPVTGARGSFFHFAQGSLTSSTVFPKIILQASKPFQQKEKAAWCLPCFPKRHNDYYLRTTFILFLPIDALIITLTSPCVPSSLNPLPKHPENKPKGSQQEKQGYHNAHLTHSPFLLLGWLTIIPRHRSFLIVSDGSIRGRIRVVILSRSVR